MSIPPKVSLPVFLYCRLRSFPQEPGAIKNTLHPEGGLDRGTTSIHHCFAVMASSGTFQKEVYPYAVTGIPVVPYFPAVPSPVRIRSSKMYSLKLSARLSSPGSFLFRIITVTLSLLSLCLYFIANALNYTRNKNPSQLFAENIFPYPAAVV